MQYQTGCVLEEPNVKDYDAGLILASTGIVKPVKAKTKQIYNQGQMPACVGMAIAGQETTQNGVVVSPRIIFAGAKEYDNFQGWGTSIARGFKSLQVKKTLPYGDIDENVGMPEDEYMRVTLTDAQKKKAERYSISSSWGIVKYGEDINFSLVYEALNSGMPLVTSMMWFESYNRPVKGFLPKPNYAVGGHAFILDELALINDELCGAFANSWGKNWGEKGYFYIPIREFKERGILQLWLTADIESDKAKILNRYQGQLIREKLPSPRHFFVNNGQIAHIKNEESFKFGRGLFWGDWNTAIEVDTIIQEDLTF
jgi:hypothetical protein